MLVCDRYKSKRQKPKLKVQRLQTLCLCRTITAKTTTMLRSRNEPEDLFGFYKLLFVFSNMLRLFENKNYYQDKKCE